MKDDALVGNAADEQQLDDATRRLSARDAIERKDLTALLSTLPGRRECWRLLSQCGIYTTSFAGEQPLTMAFHEGQRTVGLWMVARLMKHVPQLYIQMREEAARENW